MASVSRKVIMTGITPQEQYSVVSAFEGSVLCLTLEKLIVKKFHSLTAKNCAPKISAS